MDIRFLKGVGEKNAVKLQKLGIETVDDLLRHYPRAYIDYTDIKEVATAEPHQNVVLLLTVIKKHPPRRIAGGRNLFRLDAEDESGVIELVYFNNRYSYEALHEGEGYYFYGRVTVNFLKRSMISPSYLAKREDLALEPIYPLTAGITSKFLSRLIRSALAQCGDALVDEILPQKMRDRYNLAERIDAVRAVHFPQNLGEAEAAKRRLSFDELLCLQIGLSRLREEDKRVSCAAMTSVEMEEFYSALPFVPTAAQQKAITQITNDFQSSVPQNRLLQGDVGSGKTVVAAAAAYFTAKNGYKTALMAPTELLCNQHFKTLSALLATSGIEILKLSGTTKGKERKELLQRLRSEEPCILVATSAVLSEPVEFERLGFCIVDEQHRFGVRQRSTLFAKADNPHVLVMSATPIPRTLALLIYGDLDISVLDEMPKGRIEIKTRLVDTEKRARMFGFLDKEIEVGRQIYIVCPVIDESDEGLQDVVGYHNDVAKALLPSRRIGLLHGKLTAAQKAQVMQEFAAGELDILCATTVVEVGVDVPNATVMVIENAEQFGLATLHQLRGRVGRGSFESWCFLVSDSKNEQTLERLHRVVATADGFELARFDMESRGPGNFFGSEQHGLPPLTVASLARDVSILNMSTEAFGILKETDPMLKLPEHARLAEEVKRLVERFGTTTKN